MGFVRIRLIYYIIQIYKPYEVNCRESTIIFMVSGFSFSVYTFQQQAFER